MNSKPAHSTRSGKSPFLESEYANEELETHKLTELGRQEVARIWNEQFVFDERETVTIDDFTELPEAASLYDAEYTSLLEALWSAGAVSGLREGWYLARKRDGLGITFGKPSEAPVSWLVDGLILDRGVTIFAGKAGALKTWLELSLVKAVAHGEDWLGRKTSSDGNANPHFADYALAFDYEMGAAELDRRVSILGDNGLVGRRSMPNHKAGEDSFWNELRAFASDHSVRLVAIDSLRAGNPKPDENDTRFAKPLQKAVEFANEFGTSFVFLHHTGKNVTSKSDLNAILRGTSALGPATDSVYFIEAIPRSKFESKDPSEKRALVTCKKMRRAPEPEPFEVKLTDARGVELVGKPKLVKPAAPALALDASLSDEDRLYATIKANPGIGGRRYLEKSGIPKHIIHDTLEALIAKRRVENRGTTARPSHYVVQSH